MQNIYGPPSYLDDPAGRWDKFYDGPGGGGGGGSRSSTYGAQYGAGGGGGPGMPGGFAAAGVDLPPSIRHRLASTTVPARTGPQVFDAGQSVRSFPQQARPGFTGGPAWVQDFQRRAEAARPPAPGAHVPGLPLDDLLQQYGLPAGGARWGNLAMLLLNGLKIPGLSYDGSINESLAQLARGEGRARERQAVLGAQLRAGGDPALGAYASTMARAGSASDTNRAILEADYKQRLAEQTMLRGLLGHFLDSQASLANIELGGIHNRRAAGEARGGGIGQLGGDIAGRALGGWASPGGWWG